VVTAPAGTVLLDDPADPRLRDYTGLTDVSLRRVREPAEGLFIAESNPVIRRALAAGHRLRSVLLAPRWLPEVPDVLAAAREHGAEVFVAEEAVLREITGFHLHRGALASMHRPALPAVADLVAGARRVVVLEDVVDHTNVPPTCSVRAQEPCGLRRLWSCGPDRAGGHALSPLASSPLRSGM